MSTLLKIELTGELRARVQAWRDGLASAQAALHALVNEYNELGTQIEPLNEQIAALEAKPAFDLKDGAKLSALKATKEQVFRRRNLLSTERVEKERQAKAWLRSGLSELILEAMHPTHQAYLEQAADAATAWWRDRGWAKQAAYQSHFFANRIGFGQKDFYSRADIHAAATEALATLDQILNGVDPFPPFDQPRP